MKHILLLLNLGMFFSTFAQMTLYDQTATGTTAYMDACHMTDLDQYQKIADDFTIPAGEAWFISQIDLQGTSVVDYTYPDSCLVQIFDDNVGYPGNVLFEETLVFNNCLFIGTVAYPTIDVPNWVLSPGTYWISIAGYTLSGNTWRWNLLSGSNNNEVVIIDPDGSFGSPLTAWTTFPDAGITGYHGVNFRLTGDKSLVKIDEEVLGNELKVFPNPVLDQCTIQFGSEVSSFDLCSVGGQLISQFQRTASNNYDFSDLKAGIYVISWIEDGTRRQKKIVKQ